MSLDNLTEDQIRERGDLWDHIYRYLTEAKYLINESATTAHNIGASESYNVAATTMIEAELRDLSERVEKIRQRAQKEIHKEWDGRKRT